MDLWYPDVFGKICSQLGKPIHMDKLTSHKGRVTYARCLVEVDLAKELTHSVTLVLPGEVEHEQAIFYENLPRYCPHCRMMGHTKESCKRMKPNTKEDKSAKPTGKCKDPVIAETEKGENRSETPGAGTSKVNQMEWVTKKPKAGRSHTNKIEGKNKSGSTEVRKDCDATTGNKFSPLEIITETEEETEEDRADPEPEEEDCAETEIEAEV